MIRRVDVSDAVRLAALTTQLGYSATSEIIAGRLARVQASERDVVFVCVADEEVVGWIHGADQELLETGRRCEIQGLVVDERYRQRGIGRELVAAVERWAVSRNLAEMRVRSNIVRSESHPFYERVGYRRTKTQHVYVKSL